MQSHTDTNSTSVTDCWLTLIIIDTSLNTINITDLQNGHNHTQWSSKLKDRMCLYSNNHIRTLELWIRFMVYIL